MSKNVNEIKVAELFAGVGGFRIGLGKASSDYQIVWSNQWEPSTKKQEASDIYVHRFGHKGHSNEDISKVLVEDIPDHDMLVGGFPCQDYSVARTLNQAAGLGGKKGVLWWEIYRILKGKKNKPKYLFLENVDRLLKSPAKQRGRDFAIMLASLADLGYIVEWRVINAADYGMPQRRRRVFFLGYHVSSSVHQTIRDINDPMDWILKEGTLAEALNISIKPKEQVKRFHITGDILEVSDNFNKKGAGISPFENSGIMIDRDVWTLKTVPDHDGTYRILGDILLPEKDIPQEYYLDEASISKWMYQKGAKKEKRINSSNGVEYNYSEGSMVFPDPLDKPSRTIVTGEGGSSPSRFKHVIKTPSGKLRRLTPIELERLNMFPDDHTHGASDVRRAFFMGNALVVGIVEKIGQTLSNKISKYDRVTV